MSLFEPAELVSAADDATKENRVAAPDRVMRTDGYPIDPNGRTFDTRRTGGAGWVEDEWDRMHAALTAWKARSLLQQAIRELDRGACDGLSSHIADRFQRAADEARRSAAVLDELDEYLHPHL